MKTSIEVISSDDTVQKGVAVGREGLVYFAALGPESRNWQMGRSCRVYQSHLGESKDPVKTDVSLDENVIRM